MAKSNVPQQLLNDYADFVKNDYKKWWGEKLSQPHVQKMVDEFNIEFEPGSVYIKVVSHSAGHNTGVHSFIVNKPGKFPVGTILKSASWKAPATNFARADLLDPQTWVGHVSWTGAH